MQFINKARLVLGNTTYATKPYKKPATCPFCGIGTDATLRAVNTVPYRKNTSFVTVSMQCTGCMENYIALYEKVGEQLNYLKVFPEPVGESLHPCFSEISHRFVEVHKEALTAELIGLTDLAAMGYRKALEIIVKDFAIIVLGEPEDAVVKKSLADAISTYLHQDSLVKTADVVRILGNDHVHYREKYPDLDFSLLKHYYNIFLQLVVTQYEIRHPPVER